MPHGQYVEIRAEYPVQPSRLPVDYPMLIDSTRRVRYVKDGGQNAVCLTTGMSC